ncbi:imidazolonepropionase [Mesoflavibacter zeaxanthinifaciens]|uniref:imidazolonepropionase n=1 Tax=Mesoflavibacter zeaxanthinifaciens TaxID=393060 RepID=UPI000417B0D3|nr:imidazolonepropionase [Mesoflavibacter zeaxanthinifaciens]
MSILITNIKSLLQVRENCPSFISGNDMKTLPTIEDAYLLIENDTIISYGPMEDAASIEAETTIDATGKFVLPTWCDSHTHIVYAGNRELEFVDRINGLTYEEIANRGGGILNSAKTLQNTSEEELYNQSIARVKTVMKLGTGALEIKSGYGLTPEAELKMLRVIKRIKKEFPVKVRATFLGAHALPQHYKNNKQGYLDEIINVMLPLIEKEQLADYIDIFCEKGYFDLDDTKQIIEAGKKHHMASKIHVNQFNAFGGVALAVENNALSVDHLEEMNDDDIEVLKGSNTMPVALPSCSYFLSIPYTPARKMIDAGLPLALATDYNPGSTPSGNMNFVVSTACIKMKMTPEEAINAATINGAYAMGIEKQYGSITRGKKANVIITKQIPSYYYLPYSFGENNIETVIINGQIIA